MSILLTGGLGFIGSHTYIELIDKNYEVIIVDNLANSKIEQLNKLEKITNKKIKFYQNDMLDINTIDKIFNENNNIKYVIHFAGFKSVAESIKNPIKYYSHNLQILFNLIDVMTKYNCKNLVFSSSATVYGNIDTDVFSEDKTSGNKITNPYGQTKYFQEEILKDLHKSDLSWNITILRYFNPAGNHPSCIIGEDPNGIPVNLFPCIIHSIKNKTKLKIYGDTYNTYDGTCIRDFIHVVDLAKAHVKVLECKGINVYNVGTGKKTSVLDVINTFEKINNIKLDYIIADKRDGDIACMCSDCSKIKNELGWEAIYGIENMCRDSYNYFIKSFS